MGTVPTQRDIESFVEAFAEHWRDERGGFARLMHPGATLHVAGGREPLSYDDAERFVATVKQGIPDIALRVLGWAARDSSVFTEWEMTGTIGGRRVAWQGINRNTLDGAKSRDAVSRWDRHALLEQIDPGRSPLDLAVELARLQTKA